MCKMQPLKAHPLPPEKHQFRYIFNSCSRPYLKGCGYFLGLKITFFKIFTADFKKISSC